MRALIAATAVLAVACHSPGAATPAADVHGRVVRASFHSDALGVDKAYLVYLPAGYDAAPTTRWPVFYYFTGLGGTETDWVDTLHLDAVADRIHLGAIIVMPDVDDGFFVDAPVDPDYDACLRDGTGLFDPTVQQPRATQCVRHRAYETYIVKDLVAHVDATYRTIARRDGRGLAGLSMGGFGAWSLAMRHPDLFAAAASHSGVVAALYAGPHPYAPGSASWITDPAEVPAYYGDIGAWVIGILGNDLANWRAHDPATLIDKLAPGALALYLDCGTEDGFKLNDEAAWMDAALTARHIPHTYFSGPGGHDPKFWEPRGVVSLTFLRDHLAAAR